MACEVILDIFAAGQERRLLGSQRSDPAVGGERLDGTLA
jgi:hypothetical protein